MMSEDMSPNYGRKKIRLYLNPEKSPGLKQGSACDLDKDQLHYLKNVMRCKTGDTLLVFDGRHGEWLAEILELGKKTARLAFVEQTRQQQNGPDIWLLFAPVKRARLDYMAQKATEMGATRIVPVITERTQGGIKGGIKGGRINLDRLRANAIEAAEQCGLLSVPQIDAAVPLAAFLDSAGADLPPLLFCDENLPVGGGYLALEKLAANISSSSSSYSVAVLIGPEGGFTPAEREMLSARDGTLPVSLGPRILRADTAAVAALTLCQLYIGDWQAR